MNAEVFVFVVCGSAEHISTLHFSLAALKRFSKKPIWVVTDTVRNAAAIHHDHIIEHATPEHLSHHQASIYLKTRLHRILPGGNLYCYLDADMIALTEECDAVFSQWIPPVIFAPDHCTIRTFSAAAVHCRCEEHWDSNRQLFKLVNARYDRNTQINHPAITQQAARIREYFDYLKNNSWKHWLTVLRYHLSGRYFSLNDEFYYDKKEKCWYNRQHHPVLYEIDYEAIARDTGFTFDARRNTWLNRHGDDIWVNECGHLIQYIQEDLGITIAERNWQHWNGGMFLFQDSSHAFLDRWHQHTMQIFDNPRWKTRDQGTLAATVWEMGLQHHPTLDKKWNFIADYYKHGLDFRENGEFTDDGWHTTRCPAFVHIYHHFGDEQWPLWRFVKNKVMSAATT